MLQKSNLSRRSLVDLTASKVQEAKNGFIAEWKNGLKYDPDLNDFFDVFPRFAGTLALGSPLQVFQGVKLALKVHFFGFKIASHNFPDNTGHQLAVSHLWS